MFIWDKLLTKFWNLKGNYASKILKNHENPKNPWHFFGQTRGIEMEVFL